MSFPELFPVRPTRMPSAIERFFSNPTKRSYLLARQVVVARSDYRPNDFVLHELHDRLQAGEFAAVLKQVAALDDQFLLSSRLFFLGAVAATELGMKVLAESYRERFRACLSGLLATGDGTARRPYQVTYLTDERDVVQALGLRSSRQKLVETRTSVLDLLECDDGSELHFDVSALLPNRPPRKASRTRGRMEPTTVPIADRLRRQPSVRSHRGKSSTR